MQPSRRGNARVFQQSHGAEAVRGARIQRRLRPAATKQEPHSHAELRRYRRINEAKAVTLEFDRPEPPLWDTNPPEILRAGPDGGVTLIDGGQVRLAAVALMYSTGPEQMVRVVFDPVTLEIHEPRRARR